MRENCTSGSVRGASGNRGSYRKNDVAAAAQNALAAGATLEGGLQSVPLGTPGDDE